MKKITLRLFNQLNISRQLGVATYLKYHSAKANSEVSLTICGENVIVRKGTPDLKVALSCLSGEFEVLRYLLPSDFEGVIVDAGGYIGTSAIALHNLFPQAKLVVVEPSEENLSVLERNVSSFNNIRVVHGALVGKSCGSVDLKNRGTGEWGFSVVGQPKDKNDVEILHSTPAYTLSELVENNEPIGLLKLDIEGGEVDLLSNDTQTLKSIGVVFAELHDRIIDGCSDLYFKFSKDRILIKDQGEKYLSISRDIGL